MLISYSFNNFCSFNADSEFSMEAPMGKVKSRFPDNHTNVGAGYDLLKTAVIVGENAGGKSNFIGGLKFLKSLFDTNSPVQSIGAFVNASSLLVNRSPVQKFEVAFVTQYNKVYKYVVGFDMKGITEEALYVQAKRKAVFTALFSVKREDDGKYVQGDKSNNEMAAVLKNSNNSIGLFISKMALLGNKDAAEVIRWFQDILLPGAVPADQEGNPIQKDEDLAVLNDDRFMDIFKMVDYSICGIEVDQDKPYSKTLVIREDSEGHRIKRELGLDSTGVREFFAWSVQLFKVVYGNRVVFADEMDRVLNPILSDRVIAFINGSEHRGQFIFSTHNVLHLDLRTYMKEQIYFITKSKDSLTSELYSLADFPEVRYETTKIYEFYMKGILGGTAFE